MTSKQKVAILAQAFAAARDAARAADPGAAADGGTCNFDSPAIRLPRAPAALVEAAAATAGVRVAPFHWFGSQRWFWVQGFLNGQGQRRTTMAKAACEALQEELHRLPDAQAAMYYQMD